MWISTLTDKFLLSHVPQRKQE